MSIQSAWGLSLWQTVGVASRTAISLGLHRRDDVYLAAQSSFFTDSSALQAHNNHRKNVFWSLYSLDRLCMFILNKPPSIRDEDIDVDVSSLT